MKYYIGQIFETNGGMQYDSKIVFVVQDHESAEEHIHNIAKTWRGGSKDQKYDEDTRGYWEDGTIISPKYYKQIPRNDYDILVKYLP